MKKSDTHEETVREAIGVFSEAQRLKRAIDDLLANGFQNDQLGILASEITVKQQLGAFYDRTNATDDPQQAPAIEFVGREALGEARESMGGSVYFVGSTGVAGAIIASTAAFGGALAAAIGGLLGVGLVGALVASVIHQSDADELQSRVDEGHILLFVRLPHGEREQQAKEILERHSATPARVLEVPIKSGEYVQSD
jgi:hypothetical protein